MSSLNVKNLVFKDMDMTEEELNTAASGLQSWLQKQHHLPKNLSILDLKSFIIGSKSVEKAKLKIDSYFTVRNSYKFLVDRDPRKMDPETIQPCCYLPGLTPEGIKVLLIKFPEDTKKFDFNEMLKYCFMLIETMLKEEQYTLGHFVVLDAKNLSLDYISKISVVGTSQSLNCYQNSFPLRVKGILYFNAPTIVETMINTFIKPFCSEKLKSRITVYSGDESNLKSHIPIEMMPCDYVGGKSASMQKLIDESFVTLNRYRDWFLGPGSEKADESKRLLPDQDISAVQGTFRKLNID